MNIVVADLERAARFYEQVLGLRRGFGRVLEGEWLERLTRLPGARAQCLFMESDEGGARLELLQYLTPTGEPIPAASLPHTPGLRHLAFVVDSLEALVQRLRSAGVEPLSEPCDVPFQVGSLGRKRLVYFHDPDGALIEAAAYEEVDRVLGFRL